MKLLLFILPMVAAIASTNDTVQAQKHKIILAYLVPWTGVWPEGKTMGPAIIPALEAIKERGLLPGYDIDMHWRDTSCDLSSGMKMALDIWKFKKDIDVIIGDACSTVCSSVSLLASAWNVPMVSWGCTASKLSDKYVNPTFSRVSATINQLQGMYLEVARRFGWNRIGLLSDTAQVNTAFAKDLLSYLRSNNVVTFLYIIQHTSEGETINPMVVSHMRRAVLSLKKEVRVIFTFMWNNDFRLFRSVAKEENMFDGTYAFWSTDTQLYAARQQDGMLISATRITPRAKMWDSFAAKVLKSFEHPAFRGKPGMSQETALEEVSHYAAMVYDAVLLWAYGANKSLGQGFSIDNGVKVTENIINMTFEGMTGTVAIDQYGDRKQNNMLWMTQNGTLVPLMEWISNEGYLKKIYKAENASDWSGLLWPGSVTSIPSDSPPCGWQDELCPEERKIVPIIIICMVCTAVVAFAAAIAVRFRKKRLEQELKDVFTFSVPWQEIQIIKCLASQVSVQSSSSANCSRNRAFIETGKVRNVTVAIKRLATGALSISDHALLVELKIMKDLKHENINTFVGVCLEQPHACILMTYAPRGSLYDVIQDNSIKLTWDFKLSLVTDVAQGMKYLHNTPIGSHGHLTSLNCVVNSRWSCQITDYGLTYIKQKGRHTVAERQLTAWQLLWTAPELLYSCQIGSQGTLEGDVYSFAIITQEVVLQDMPYAADYPQLEPEDILDRVKEMENPPYRPYLDAEYCNSAWRDLMVQCWDEDRDKRPTFSTILMMIQEIAGGQTPSLVDGMIDRLESHTKQLEEMVEERYKELQEEKVKMEVILQDLLPRCVAEKLQNGLRVVPESFDEVSIFFSDIVSFTRISAAGTPIDVVKMLNFMYTLFDNISAMFDVYKVATIGDAYFVASGVPTKNGERHAAEICNMALKLMNGIQDCPIPHLPEERLKMRIGIHSGPCVAAVVGTKMPRYLLFGETVDAASNMEASGVSMRIHISDATKRWLDKTEGFETEERGCMDIKAIGKTVTYFLNDRRGT